MKTAKTFEPIAQFEDTMRQIGETMSLLNANFERLEWLRDRAIEQFRATADAAEKIETYTEAEAAELLKVSERTIGDLRRDGLIPFLSFGQSARYTRQQINEICRIVESRPKGSASIQRAA